MPILLGIAIMYWVYRGEDGSLSISSVSGILSVGLDWWWMSLSLFFGVLAQVARGLRWVQTLEPIGEYPRRTVSINSIFVSYAANIVLPRVGEISRCGILRKYDGVSFSKSIGTVVMERAIDTVCILALTLVTILMQFAVFNDFFNTTGTKLENFALNLTLGHYLIIGACTLAVIVLGVVLVRCFSLFARIRGVITHVLEGVLSLRKVENKWLFAFYTIAIWGCYLLHFYLTFYCFDFTYGLGFMAGLVMFVVGSIAVAVPTPNGLGPWHFAVMTMMILYGVDKADAGVFALIVHGLQTLLIIVLGIVGLLALTFTTQKKSKTIEYENENN